MELPDYIQTHILLQNNAPVDNFMDLSPVEMHELLYDPFGDKSPVQLRDDIDDAILDQIPLFRIAEEYLKIVQRDKQIKLTALGALPKKVMVELYDKRFLLNDHIEKGTTKLSREIDCIEIRSARLAVGFAGLVKKVSNKITLTKAGTKLLETNDRLQIFKRFFQAFTHKFAWGYNDGYPPEPIGQFGWIFSLILLDKYGDEYRTVDLYAEKYLTALPSLIRFFNPSYTTPERQFLGCYCVRTFDRFFLWFGLVTVEKQSKYWSMHTDKYKQTHLVRSIFKIDDL